MFEIIKNWIECIFDSLKVFYSVLLMLQGQPINQLSNWMPSLLVTVLTISLALILILRIVGR